MAKFIKGSEIGSKLEKIIQESEESLILISPYIKLHSRIIDALTTKRSGSLQIKIVFGKNEGRIEKSLTQSDFQFLSEFANIEIRYNSRLHAKFYANENALLLTSMNLYDHSQNNNIEFGVYEQYKGYLHDVIGPDSFAKDARCHIEDVLKASELLFHRVTPAKQKGLSFLYKKKEPIFIDNLSDKYESAQKKPESKVMMGYCIRTKERIPFNLERPLGREAFAEWRRFKNPAYKEKYCHYSGEESHGMTCFEKPVLKKYWKEMKENVGN